MQDRALTQEYFSILASLQGDIEGRRNAQAYMQDSTAIVHHQVVACSFIPRFYNEEIWHTFATIAETTHTILCKVIARYLDDADYRSIFSYDPRLEELILLPRGYDALLPFARIDVFLDEDTLECGFCEFNADGSSGMNENREITHSIEQSQTFQLMAQAHTLEPCELFYTWAREFIAIYQSYQHAVKQPRFAICDYLDHGVVDEFNVFCTIFAELGYDCIVCDVRDLVFDGETLHTNEGLEINAIWRRSVTNDVLEFWDESQDLINAVRAEKVALIGSFAGHIVHDKQIFEALYHPLTQAFLTPEENEFIAAHIPQTRFLDDKDVSLAEIRATKDKWIIKPTDAYGAQDVFAGIGQTQEAWDALISRFANSASGSPFLVQRYIKPYQTLTLPPDTTILSTPPDQVTTTPQWYNNLQGLYVYNGVFTGVFSRLGPQPTISKDCEGMTAATIHVYD